MGTILGNAEEIQGNKKKGCVNITSHIDYYKFISLLIFTTHIYIYLFLFNFILTK